MFERGVLRARNRPDALLHHVALYVGEHGRELGLVADRSEIGIEVAVVAPPSTPAGFLGLP